MPASSVMTLLKKHKQEQLKMKSKAGDLWVDMDLVFTDEYGKFLYYGRVSRNFKKISNDMGLPQERFHDLRHPYVDYSTKK